MSLDEVREKLAEAHHEIGHAYASLGAGRYLGALIEARRAKESLQRAIDSLDKIQD